MNKNFQRVLIFAFCFAVFGYAIGGWKVAICPVIGTLIGVIIAEIENKKHAS